ncbi:MAG: hypothetical protein MZV49_06080 [Rhodopseudomonas palustris]|nr:hypothetical protein [Rhodopseudomonas palustris]
MLAASFGTYGLIRKVVAVEAVPGLATETLLLAPFAVGVPAVGRDAQGTARSGHSSALDQRAAGRQRAGHGAAARAVRLRRAPDSALDDRPGAVHRPDAAVPDRRAGVQGSVHRRTRGGLSC